MSPAIDFMIGSAATITIVASTIFIIEKLRLPADHTKSKPEGAPSDHDRQNTQHESSNHPDPVPSTLTIDAVIDEPPRIPGAENHHQETHTTFRISDPDLSSWTKWLVVWTAALVFTAVGSDVFQGLQWIEIKTADVESSRAWVGPQSVSSTQTPTSGKPLDVVINYTNSGRTPATDFVPTFDEVILDATDKSSSNSAEIKSTQWIKNCRSATISDAGSVAFPSTGFSTYKYSFTVPADKLTADVDKKAGMIAVLGCFIYGSAERTHHTSFCFFFRHDTGNATTWNICPGGTYAD
jgi:hypothetical protein